MTTHPNTYTIEECVIGKTYKEYAILYNTRSHMPITRSELREQREKNQKNASAKMIDNMFDSICHDVTTCNMYGSTTHTIDLRYRMHWTQPLMDRLVEKLKAHYIDSHIWECDKAVRIEWNIDDSDIVEDSPTNSVIDVKNVSGDPENIQINISFPTRVTRSSSRK